MLDSGASSNFMSVSLVEALQLKMHKSLSHKVRLADGKILQTLGQVKCKVDFGGYTYLGSFHVLNGEVPLILGMDFLTSAHPHIDFRNKQVVCYAGTQKYNLPTCDIGTVEDHVAGDQNVFSGLEVEDSDVEITSDETGEKLADVGSSRSNDTMAGDCRDESVLKVKRERKC